MTGDLRGPEPLSAAHRLDAFDCGTPALDDWLRRRALVNHLTGASRTFVVTDGTGQVRGYYALAAGAVTHELATRPARRNMPDPIPAIVLARLAVDQPCQGRQLGGALLRDAVQRAGTVSWHAGVRVLLVHAIDEQARRFYEHYGFQPSPVQAMTLMLRLGSTSTV